MSKDTQEPQTPKAALKGSSSTEWPLAILRGVSHRVCSQECSWSLPGVAEANMSQRNTAINEEDGKTRQRQEPVENISTVWRQVDESEASEEELKDDHRNRATLSVNVSEQLGTHACAQS